MTSNPGYDLICVYPVRRELHRDVDPNEKSKFMILSTVVSPLFDIENNAMFEDLVRSSICCGFFSYAELVSSIVEGF